MKDWKEKLLTAILECGISDLEKMEEFIKKAENWNVRIDLYDIIEEAKTEFGKIEFNTILYLIMRNIFYDLIQEFEEKDKEILYEEFNPYLNYLDSFFNNPLDELDENSTREDAINKLKEWLNEIKEEKLIKEIL